MWARAKDRFFDAASRTEHLQIAIGENRYRRSGRVCCPVTPIGKQRGFYWNVTSLWNLRRMIDGHCLWKKIGRTGLINWCKSTDNKQFLAALEEINLEIKRRFDGAGLSFAFPTQTVQLQQA